MHIRRPFDSRFVLLVSLRRSRTSPIFFCQNFGFDKFIEKKINFSITFVARSLGSKILVRYTKIFVKLHYNYCWKKFTPSDYQKKQFTRSCIYMYLYTKRKCPSYLSHNIHCLVREWLIRICIILKNSNQKKYCNMHFECF